jgi:putative membrane-bound dehydrogenase-like protein
MGAERVNMNRTRIWLRAMALVLLVCWPVPGRAADEIPLAQDAPGPLSPDESQQLFRLPAGLRVELVASEPLLADPVAIAFDARGRMLVCELHGYNLEGYLDIVALNKTGVLDREVRRIPASEEALAQAARDQYGTVKRLEDRDGDGRMDHVSVLADRLPPCYGLVPARKGVIVFCAPDIVYLEDADDEGVAESRDVLFTGFGVGELWTRINNPRWVYDNWIYGVSGMQSGGTIRGPHLPHDVQLGSVCFRFRADGSAIEPVSGWTHGFGQAVDQWGDRFLCTNQQHALHVVPLEYRYLVRNPFFPAPDPTWNICSYGHPARVYPTSQPDPWRRQRAADPRWVQFYGEAEATANGYFTAASGQTIYRGTGLPSAYRGSHFSVDNAQNLIHRCRLVPEGVTYRAERPDPAEQQEFLTSSEQWFRPVNLLTGPDGMLYVVDMYRDIIEDYSAIPRYLQQLYVRSLIAGAERGRIWRVVPDGAQRAASIDLERMTAAELVTQLASAEPWRRETAQRLLVERGDRTVAARLEVILAQETEADARVHALYTLDGLGLLSDRHVQRALRDAAPLVRVHALRLAERWLAQPDAAPLRDAALPLIDDPHPRVRLQATLSLGTVADPAVVTALARVAAREGQDPWFAAAVLASSLATADELAARLLTQPVPDGASTQLLATLCSVVGARRDRAQLIRICQALDGLPASCPAHVRAACLQGLCTGLERSGAAREPIAELAPCVARWLAGDDDSSRQLAVQLAAHLGVARLPAMEALVAAARQRALEPDAPLEDRVKSVDLLAAAAPEGFDAVLDELLTPRQSSELQVAAIAAAARANHVAAMELALGRLASCTPAVQSSILDAAFSRESFVQLLLDAVARGTVDRTQIDAARRERLVAHRDPTLAARSRELLLDAASAADRREVLERYRAALVLDRNSQRGQAVFEKQCAKCHRLGDQGFAVGPDLLTARTRADETLMTDLLDPSSQLTVGYPTYTVITSNGRIFTGVLAAESATSLTLREQEGKESVILRQEVDELTVSSVSMMPEKLEQELSPQDVADLLGFLRRATASTQPAVAVLFDDELQFAALLSEGDGTATVTTRDAHAGTAALAIRPLQRFSATLPGWEYRITEHPGPGEYRYLQFAWKATRGDGVMLELAANGTWPGADQPQLRYYSGRNTTPWQATQITDQAPAEWTVVTRDLWQDFGAMTLTGLAPTALGGEALFDSIRLLREEPGGQDSARRK